MKTKGFRIAGFALLAVTAVIGFGLVVMLLWNAVVPDIFGLGIINFWQALGLLTLTRILFGGIGHGGGRGFGRMHHHRNAIREKWMSMTPDERKEFAKRRKEHMFGDRFGRRGFFGNRDTNFERENFDEKNNGQ